MATKYSECTDPTNASKRQATILRMKDEILRDVLANRVPRTIADFSDLQSHVDANMYGGFGETDAFPEGWSTDGQMTPEHVEFINACQQAVCQWIRQGGISAIDALELFDGGPGACYYRVMDEKDAADYLLFVTDHSTRQRPATPESEEICFTIRHSDNAELVSVHHLTGRAGLIAWYQEHVGHNPDQEDEGGPLPILELVTSVALHLMYREMPEF
ncbi:hypothetical protein [Duganella vulcania]|uniref:Uncharacterized protein n=1 Tax=Duganella vulcania TaxID=2692166 RepID=A0A845GHR8_9BURK|nr:hypothetical protein [Duganella vulcania]MYM92588.1 hypothetical protein [Duganella vulcania]